MYLLEKFFQKVYIMIEINDTRDQKEFLKITFSNYKKTEAKKAFIKALNGGEIESACYWGCEFICAGHFAYLWEILIEFMSKYIHLGNPKLAIYLDIRFNLFREILINGYINNEIRLRNNEKIRKLFAEITTILCLSRKKHSLNVIKIKKDEFKMTNITNRLKAKKITYSKNIFRRDDPKELFIAVNELGFHLSSESKNSIRACWWIEWIIEFSCLCNKEKKECKADRRSNIPVENKLQTDIIWIVWEMLLHYSKEKNKICHSIVNALLNLFCIRFNLSTRKKRRYILYFAVSLITDNIDYDVKIFESKEIINTIVSKIDIIYKQIKKNEVAPKTDYLFNNSIIGGKKNLENTIKKIETMNSLMNIVTRK